MRIIVWFGCFITCFSLFVGSEQVFADSKAFLPENIEPPPATPTPTPTATPTPTPSKLSCMIYQARRGPGSGSRWRSGVDYPYYNAWLVWIPAPTNITSFLRWGVAGRDFRYEDGWVMSWGAAPGSTFSGNYDPCNRCYNPTLCAHCSDNIVPMPVSVTYQGFTYRLMDKPYAEGGRCGTAECPCYVSGIVSPLVIAFSNDPIQYTKDGEHILFDMGEGAAATSWIKNGKSVAFLALDKNANGQIDSVQELFGNATLGRNQKEAENGFAALREYDSNADQIIDSQDEVFHRLVLWFDFNADGKTDTNELKSLVSVAIKSIDLKFAQMVSQSDSYGNASHEQSLVQLSDGSTRPVYDVWFAPVSPLSVKSNPGGRGLTLQVPREGSTDFEIVHKAWGEVLKEQDFSEGEMPYASGNISQRFDANGNLVEREARWSHSSDNCRIDIVFQPDWTIKKSFSDCQ